MISCETFYNLLLENDIDFLCGVPDSQLKDFLAYIDEHADKKKNIITANEGNAIALAAGYHMATGKIGMAYMQNSGLGNSVNPLVSLVDKEVYSIPVLLLVGWRGEPGIKDEPQHIKQGRITEDLLKALKIPYQILPENIEEAENALKDAVRLMKENSAPYALVVRKKTFEPYKPKAKTEAYSLSREEAIHIVVSNLSMRDIIVSTTGMPSRELFECREELGHGHEKDFLTVGSMGHCSHIALAIAISKPSRDIYCIDGDGALIMHMGALPIIASRDTSNFKHILINNGAHDSVGGQPTVGCQIDILTIAKACGYKNVHYAETADQVKEKMSILKSSEGPAMLEIRVKKGARKDLGRPTIGPKENKVAFMRFIK